MESQTDYGFIIIICLAVAYMLVGLLRLTGYFYDGKIILICSLCSVIFAIISIIETLVTGYKQAQKSLLSQMESDNYNYAEIQKNYTKKINWLHKLKNFLLFITMTLFFFLMPTDFINENSTLADGLSLLSFSLILMDISLKMYLEKIIVEFKIWIKKIKRGEKENDI